jgi:hypothetical protein
MLLIEIQQNGEAVIIKLEGRLAGSAVGKLDRAWVEFAPLLGSRPLTIDLRKLTRADAYGVKALRNLQALTGARLVTNSPLTKYVAEDIARRCASNVLRKVREAAHGRSGHQRRYGML